MGLPNRLLVSGLCFVALALRIEATPTAQSPGNRVINPDFSAGTSDWQSLGDVSVEQAGEGRVLAIRNGGQARQFIPLPPESVGRFVLFTGRGSSERVNSDGAITGLPYIYGQFLTDDRARIVLYTQGPSMRARPTKVGEWVAMTGIAQIPARAGWLVIQLSQATAGVPHNGSAARFDDIGVYVFESLGEALAATGLEAAGQRRLASEVTRQNIARSWTNLRPPSVDRPSEDVTPVAGVPAIAFDPSRGVVFDDDRVVDLLPACSRPWPYPIQGAWNVDGDTIGSLEAALPALLQRALDRSGDRVHRASDYYRQYLGLIVDGRRIVYVNGFVSAGTTALGQPVSWRIVQSRICDGGRATFGATFDIASGLVTSLHFN